MHRDAVFGITNALVVCDGRCRERAWPQETGCVDASHDTSLHVVCALKTGSLFSSLARCSLEPSPQLHQRPHMPSSFLASPRPPSQVRLQASASASAPQYQQMSSYSISTVAQASVSASASASAPASASVSASSTSTSASAPAPAQAGWDGMGWDGMR